MNELTDQQLLREYAERRSEAAFAELVRRHIDLVHSAAMRMVRNTHLAEDVTQGAFVALARSAPQLTKHAILSGWLHRTAQNIAAQTVRTDVRRRSREQEAATMNELSIQESDGAWEDIEPHLDDALDELSEPDRDVLMLRFFERKSAHEMAQVLGISSDAAQKRLTRAVERLREFFAKRGVTVGAGGLVTLVSVNAVQAAPVGLVAAISTASTLAGITLSTTATSAATSAIAMTTLQKSLTGAVLTVAVGMGLYEVRRNSILHAELKSQQLMYSQLRRHDSELERERDEALLGLTRIRDSAEKLNLAMNELAKLRTDGSRLRGGENESVKPPTTLASSPSPRDVEVNSAWVQQVLDSPPKDLGAAVGALRGKLLRGEVTSISPSELALRDALLQRQLNQSMERSPVEFADFQSAFIQWSLGISDDATIREVHEIIRATYEHAVSKGLDIPSKPASGSEDWVQQRFQLDRQATEALKQLFTPEESQLFDRAFLGVMGVDLGGVGVDKSNYPKGFLGAE